MASACHAWGVTGQKSPSLSPSREHTPRNRICASLKRFSEVIGKREFQRAGMLEPHSGPSPTKNLAFLASTRAPLSLKPETEVAENSQRPGQGLRASEDSSLAKSETFCWEQRASFFGWKQGAPVARGKFVLREKKSQTKTSGKAV